ncbi:hypothetical protein C2E21_2722 [Chlorella sorokiniana]|uniref:Very-long-chain (3R)-3-hydroxyacyl-CoA dehydratase n=1 Tax=Chlorella sorokiniana TaxID=3076 RepID=A0A2P6TVL4_CHLSO|nr:hypothetical protein C2E21_2722 [Chlorella sorokiniana]|eukprot:PRW58097.1 hypothetical protein C2E21_2722 [Chlorella sorokiniana]
MAFEMSLPHAPRIRVVAPDGGETHAEDEAQWALYYSVQRALQEQDGQAPAEGEGGEEGGKAAAAKAPQPSDPQKVLSKLLTARGELDVITDLVTFVEQQQFLAVEGIHRPPPTLEERTRARALRLAAARQQLHGAAGLLGRGLAALQAQAAVDDRFLADLSQLRRRWKLRRHAGAGPGAAGLFYADISLPLRGALARAVSQEGVQCNIIQDTNGDACIVEAAAPGGKRQAVRGWRHIHAVLEAKQALLAWRVMGQLLAAAARLPQHEADPDGAVAALQRLAAAAAADAQAAVHRAVASAPQAAGAAAASMDVDANGEQQQSEAAAALAAPASLPAGMLSSAAQDLQAALSSPGFQQQFEARALLLLSHLLTGGSSSGASAVTAADAETAQQALLAGLLRWLRHAAACQRPLATMTEFTKVIPASCLRGSGLLLTPEFRDAVVPETGTYTLQNAEGKQTTCTITRKAQGAHERCDIHGGWRQFARDNEIKEGDEVRIRHLGGRVIEITKTGRTGTPGRTPAKAAKTPGRSRASGSGSKTPRTAEGGVAKRRSSSSAKKAKPAAAAGTPASPASGRRGRRSSQGAASAARAARAAPAEDDWQGQQEQAAGSSGWCSLAGWAVALYRVGGHVIATRSLEGAYTVAGDVVGCFQLASALEILHAALGLVGGSPLTALMQWAGRSNVLFGVVAAVPEVQNRPAVGAMFLAWALSEIIRYPWYAASLAGACPHWLTWLRYTAFIGLYPVGVLGEMKSVFDALPFIKARGLRSLALPNAANWGFDYHTFLVVLLCLYPFLWFRLYAFLFRQRRKKLGAPAAVAGSKKRE